MVFKLSEIAFLQRLVSEQPCKRPTGASATLFADHHGIGRVIGRGIEYVAEDFERAAQVLRNHRVSFTPLPAKSPRASAAGRAGVSEKSGTQAPHGNSVLVKPAAGRCMYGTYRLYAPPGGYLVLTAEDTLKIKCDLIMLVENMEVFRRLERYGWIEYGGLSVLAVYRGDSTFWGRDAMVAVKGSPRVWFFGDFDPAGLGIALEISKRCNLERVVHPPLPWLEERVRQTGLVGLYGDQIGQYQDMLSQTSREDVAALWKLMRRLQSGLPQEWMTGVRAVMAPLS